MRRIFYTTQFKRDLKHIQKQSKDVAKLKTVIEMLVVGEVIDEKYRDHPLDGNYTGVQDCHISPHWLLIYAVVGDELRLICTSLHAELFD